MKYETNDGRVFEAKDAREVIRELRADSFDGEGNVQDFMRETAARARMQMRAVSIPTDTEANFVEGLVRSGFLKKLEG